MTEEEVLKLQDKMDVKIAEAVKEFTLKTGLSVANIEVYYTEGEQLECTAVTDIYGG
jgi:hypothetical protein